MRFRIPDRDERSGDDLTSWGAVLANDLTIAGDAVERLAANVARIGTVAGQACVPAGCGLVVGLAVAGSWRLPLAGLLTSLPSPAAECLSGCIGKAPIPPLVVDTPAPLW